MTRFRIWWGAAAGLLLSTIAAAPQAQGPTNNALPQLETSLVGKDSFALYCASCHGVSGRGDGPVAAALRTRPADLTALARRNDGAYPRESVRDFIAGVSRTPAAHGTTEMPIWGSLFRAFESDARVRVRLENLVGYIETLQAPTTGAASTGSQLFRAHCASCHGSTGRGNGPLAENLRRTPPDLTKFTARNGGVFPSERLARIIDGRDVASHGDREMPVWGDIFKYAGDGFVADAVKARIEAIIRYLEGIQERAA